MIRRMAVVVGFCLLSLSAGAQSFTLQQVLSAPFSSALQASPAGGRFLWIANQQGKRNIWVAEASGSAYTAHRVTSDDADDGVDLGDITWTPDGEQIVYARGGDFEFPGKEAANPAMLPQGVTEEIWIAGVHGGDARKLAEGRAPAVSPDGQRIAFAASPNPFNINFRLFVRPLNAPTATEILIPGSSAGFPFWSPDGQQLLVARVDTSPVTRFYLADPANPERPPAVVAYPVAGTANADVSVVLAGLDGAVTPVAWDSAAAPYLTTVHWSPGGPALLQVVSRDQRTLRVMRSKPNRSGTTAPSRLLELWLGWKT